jgi:hypothetical protein
VCFLLFFSVSISHIACSLPVGLAAMYVQSPLNIAIELILSSRSLASCASLCGVAGAIIAMAQAWYVGPVAAKLGPIGGDMGFEFAAVFAGIAYPPLRWLEIRKWNR